MADDLEKSRIVEQAEVLSEPPANLETVKEMAQRAEAQVVSEEQEVLEAAEKQIVPPPSLGLEQSRANIVFENEGFAQKIQAIKARISDLTRMTREKIATLMTSQSVEHQPRLKDFSEMLNRGEIATAELLPESRSKVSGILTEMGSIADVARETINENDKPETIAAKTEAVDQTSTHRLAKGESILEKENPFKYMAAVRVSNNLPEFKNGKLVLKTAFDMRRRMVSQI